MKRNAPRIFVGTEEIAGYYARLTYGFRQLDVPVTRILRHPHKFQYERPSFIEHTVQKVRARFLVASKTARKWNPALAAVPRLEQGLTRWLIANHDLFIFGFMYSLNGLLTDTGRLRDLIEIKKAGKKIICVFHGSEVRPSWLNGANKETDAQKIAEIAQKQIKLLRIVEQYADAIVSHPPMGPLQQREYAQYLAVGIPLLASSFQQQDKPAGSRPFRVIHAPSNPQTKGSAEIQSVIARLEAEGWNIEFKMLTNMPNAKVTSEIGKADLLIDQLYSDTPMAHLAAEAAAQSCPAIVCGHDLKSLRGIIPKQIWPPSITGDPGELYNLVRWALENEAELKEIGKRAQDFVIGRWNAAQVARNFLRMAESGIPDEWRFDPARQRFWGGYGMTLDERDNLVERTVEAAGIQSVGLPSEIELPLPRC